MIVLRSVIIFRSCGVSDNFEVILSLVEVKHNFIRSFSTSGHLGVKDLNFNFSCFKSS